MAFLTDGGRLRRFWNLGLEGQTISIRIDPNGLTVSYLPADNFLG
jgi:hypothetical protein